MAFESTGQHVSCPSSREVSAVSVLDRLVAFDTGNPPGRERDAADYLSDLIQGFGFEVRQHEVGEGRTNLVAQVVNGGGPTLAFNTHLDTVPAGDGWTLDPFRLTRGPDGQLFGRGACDAKGPLSAMVAAATQLVAQRRQWSGTLLLVFVADEEVGSAGARAYAATRPSVDFAVIGEPTRNLAAIAHKGSLRPLVRVVGRSAHSSRPDQGVNAVFDAARLLAMVEAAAPGVAERRHPLCGTASLTVTRISGGFADNAIPDRCEFLVDRRLVPGEDEANVKAEIGALIEAARRRHGIDASVVEWCPTTGGATETALDAPIVLAARAASGAHGGDASRVIGLGGACDLVHFNALGASGVVIGPGDMSLAHKPDEWIDQAELEAGVQTYVDLAKRMLQS